MAFAQASRVGEAIVNPDGKVTYLGTLGGNYSRVKDINDSGQVVGSSQTAGGSYHAFITGPDGKGMTDVNSYADLPDGIFVNQAYGINNLGQVIANVSGPPLPLSPNPPPMP